MLTAKLVRLDTAWSATPHPRRRTAWPLSRQNAAIRDIPSPADACVSASAATPGAQGGQSQAKHGVATVSAALVRDPGARRGKLGVRLPTKRLVDEASAQ